MIRNRFWDIIRSHLEKHLSTLGGDPAVSLEVDARSRTVRLLVAGLPATGDYVTFEVPRDADSPEAVADEIAAHWRQSKVSFQH